MLVYDGIVPPDAIFLARDQLTDRQRRNQMRIECSMREFRDLYPDASSWGILDLALARHNLEKLEPLKESR